MLIISNDRLKNYKIYVTARDRTIFVFYDTDMKYDDKCYLCKVIREECSHSYDYKLYDVPTFVIDLLAKKGPI